MLISKGRCKTPALFSLLRSHDCYKYDRYFFGPPVIKKIPAQVYAYAGISSIIIALIAARRLLSPCIASPAPVHLALRRW